jgi:hypothetical protein
MKTAIILFAAILLFLTLFSFSGYEIEITSDGVAYENDSNTSFSDRTKSIILTKGQTVSILGCLDNGNDIYTLIQTKKGVIGYYYAFEYDIISQLNYSKERFYYFLNNPLSSMQCHIMVPRQEK